jgi:uncharacterized membrane protein
MHKLWTKITRKLRGWIPLLKYFCYTLSGVSTIAYSVIDAEGIGLYASHILVMFAGAYCAIEGVVRTVRILKQVD